MPNDDFERFRALHEMDGRAPLNKVERAEYDRVKERFAEAICAGQQLAVKPGQTARATFRVALLFRLTLTIDGVAQQTATFDVSGGGFGAHLAATPSGDGSEVGFEMFLTKAEAISGRARIIEVRSNHRALFAFVDLKPAHAERLERLLFDEILRQLVRAAAPASSKARG
jgi:hypothetical protein